MARPYQSFQIMCEVWTLTQGRPEGAQHLSLVPGEGAKCSLHPL
jgi:hypothetical protein